MRVLLGVILLSVALAVAPCLGEDQDPAHDQVKEQEQERYGGGGRRPIGGWRPAVDVDGAIAYPEDDDLPASTRRPEPDGDRLRVLAGWKQLDFEFPDEATRRAMVDSGQFVPVNNMIIDVDVYAKGRSGKGTVFLTVPRTRPGVPVTLATIGDRRNDRGEPLLRPFPDWKTNNAFYANDCDNSLTSVFRVFVDDCGRLWVLDCGVVNANNGNPSMQCPPKLVVYDLNDNNRLIGSYPVASSLLEANSMLITVVVETRVGGGECGGDDAYAYVADSMGGKLLVFSLRQKLFWRVNSILFAPYPDQATFNVSGVLFDVPAGIFGLALGPESRGSRRLYLHGIASVRQSWVEAAVLRNRTLWRDNMNAAPRAVGLLAGARPSQSVVSAMTGRGLMLFTLSQTNEIACWNSQTPFGGTNIVPLLKDDEKLQFNVGIKVYRGKLYLTSNRIQNFVTNRVKTDEVNYRVMEADLRRLTDGTACSSPSADRFHDEYAPFSETVDDVGDLPPTGPTPTRDPSIPTASV